MNCKELGIRNANHVLCKNNYLIWFKNNIFLTGSEIQPVR